MSDIIVAVPTREHVEELKEKGIDLETELARIVYDNARRVEDGLDPKLVRMSFTKEQIEQAGEYGIDLPGELAREFKKELHTIMEGKESGLKS